MLESSFQGQLIKELKKKFPGCIVTKNDSSYIQGIPDLTIHTGLVVRDGDALHSQHM